MLLVAQFGVRVARRFFCDDPRLLARLIEVVDRVLNVDVVAPRSDAALREFPLRKGSPQCTLTFFALSEVI
jgi:hypothetical protein